MHSISYYQQKFNEALKAEILSDYPAELYNPIKYILSLGGKRIRPTLLLMSCEMFGNTVETGIPAALAIEMFHNFTLIHDDIMDEAPIRRGKETVYKKWNTNIAILAGDTMMPLSYDYILRVEDGDLRKVLEVFNQTAKEVCEGQQFDLNFETSKEVSISQYLEMIRLKTAVLIAASLKIGAQIAHASLNDLDNIYEFGLNIGMAFQLRDDYLDAFGDENIFGKQTGGDITTNKKTFLYLKALELADDDQYEKLVSLFSQNDLDNSMKIDSVIGIYNQLDIKTHTENLIENYFVKSLDFLDKISLGDDKKEELKKLAYKIVDREY